MRQQESVPVPRCRTGGPVWKGAGASLLLHLFVGAAVIVALPAPPNAPPRVIDLTLLSSPGIARRPAPTAIIAAATPSRPPGTDVLPEPPVLPAAQAAANPPTLSAAPPVAAPPDPASIRSAPAAGSPHPSVTASPATSGGPVKAAAGRSPETGTSGAGSPASDFAWIRDAIQHAIAYPETARKMGWEGKVVVAFLLLSDGSVRDVRVVQGSGHATLDRGAIDAVRNASPFRRSPLDAEVITPVVYRLTTR